VAVLAPHAGILAAAGEIVTATPRQARWLQAALGRAALGGGRSVWASPRVSPYPAWLAARVRALDDRPELLDAVVERRLWLQVVADSEAGARLLNLRAAAGAAARAWAFAQDWRLPLGAGAPLGPDEAAFAEWAREFERRTAALGVLDAARLPALYARRLAPGQATPVGFHGFAERTPARVALAAALLGAGRETRELALEAPPAVPRALAAASAEAEADLIVEWAVERLGADPLSRLIVLMPELGPRAAALARCLDDALAPQLLAPGAADGRPYAFGTAAPLGEQAVVQAALDVLALGAGTMDLYDFGRLLRGPYLPGDGVAELRRARLDEQLRALGARLLVPAELVHRLRDPATLDPEFAARIEAVRGELDPARARGPAEWAETFQRALRVAGWPKGRALGEREYEAARALSEAVASLAGLARLLPVLSFAAARAELAVIVAATALGAERGEASLLVLDGLDDPALPCDGLWVAGLTAERFPGTARTTPLLSLGAQRARGIPAASPDGMLAAGRATLAGWLRCAPEVVLSAPLRAGEARLVRSALVPAAGAPITPGVAGGRARQLRAAGVAAPYVETRGLQPLAGPALAGGVKVLELQAACPFRAAAVLRLGASAPETPRAGLSALVRGELAHEALAAFWRDVGDQATLAGLDAPARRTRVTAAVERALRQMRARPVAARLLRLERDWLVEAIDRLAALELAREPFEVLERETSGELRVGGHALRIRIDRVDRLADGSVVLIDYKTGRTTPRRWIGPRPDAMQLAAYALSRPETTSAVANALLAPAHTGYAGLAARAGVLPRVRALAEASAPALRALDWVGLVARWRELATGLANDYATGVATVDPAPNACDYCGLELLCRIANAAPADAEGDDEAEGADD
jgi:probable DNA repair protein